MSITITINGENAEHARYEMEKLLGIVQRTITSALSDVSPDTPKTVITETAAVESLGVPTRRRGRPAKLPEGPALNVVANISTGDERVHPDAEPVAVIDHAFPEPSAEEAKAYTMEDVRNAATPYIKKHTMAFAQLDLQDCLEAAVGIRQISKLDPTKQDMLKKAVEAFEAAGNAETRFVKAA